MTVAEKLAVIDTIWRDLRRRAEQIPAPDWHRQILEARREAFERGEIGYSDWEDAKDEIRRRVS